MQLAQLVGVGGFVGQQCGDLSYSDVDLWNPRPSELLGRGDLDDAATHVRAAFAGEHEVIFRDHGPDVLAEVSNSDRTGGARTLMHLQAAQLCFLRDDPEGEDIVADLLRRALEDSAEETFLRRLLEDYPFHDFDRISIGASPVLQGGDSRSWRVRSA